MSKPKNCARTIQPASPLMASRAAALRFDASGRPASLDEKTRSIVFTASTEEAVYVWDWDRWDLVPEVLLMSGVRLPASGRCPFLDSHSRMSVSDVIGSARDFAVIDGPYGPELQTRCQYSATADGEGPYIKTSEGHVTDVSVGYEINLFVWIEEGKTATVGDREYTGPLRVVSDWTLKEVSLCAIGADPNAKARSQTPTTPNPGDAAGQKKETVMAKDPSRRRNAAGKKVSKEVAAERAKALRELAEEQEREAGEEDDQETPPDDADAETTTDTEDEDNRTEGEDEENRTEGEDDTEEEDGARARTRVAVRAERARISEIQGMCRELNIAPEMEAQFIQRGTTLARASQEVVNMLRANAGKGPGVHVVTGRTEKEKASAAIQDAILLRCGIALKDKPAPGAEELRSLPLAMLCREFLFRSGHSVQGDIRDIVGRALTTTDLPQLLVATTRRVLFEAFAAAEETWRKWCEVGSTPDFKKSTLVGLEGDFSLLEKPEYGEAQYAHLKEHGEEYYVKTYSKIMRISRNSLINDDLSALTRLPVMYGEAAARLVGDVAYGALLNAPKMGDGKALFHADHRNLFAGMGGPLTVDNIGAIVKGMKLQKDLFGNTITIQPRFFLAPVSMETQSEQFFGTQLPGAGPVVGTGDAPLVRNPYGGNIFERVYERRLEDNPEDFYLAAQRNTVTVFFLNGVEEPFVESQNNFETDGFDIKVRHDVGAKALRWVTMAKATAPVQP